MKYIVILGDGMADQPLAQLGEKTPLEAAHKETMDYLARFGELGMVQSIPDGMSPGSDTANLSILGYDPKQYYTGRSPLEAVSMGIEMADDAICYRCNLVSIEGDDLESARMLDHSSGEISTQEAKELIESLQEAIDWEENRLYPGVSYRHALLMPNNTVGTACTPPHDIVGEPIAAHLPSGKNEEPLRRWIAASQAILKNHPVNRARRERGLHTADICWFWGEGTRPALPNFEEKTGKRGGMISAVDLLKGIALCAGMDSVDVAGATGTLNTDYEGKLKAALRLLEDHDFVYIHVEAPDECGHQGNIADKVESIERIDRRILRPLMEALDARGEDYSILLTPDHATPLALRTHTSDPIPYVLYSSKFPKEERDRRYTERDGEASGVVEPNGHALIDKLFAIR